MIALEPPFTLDANKLNGTFIVKKQIIIFLLSLAPLGYTAEMNQAVILEHHSWVSGANEQGRAIEGHIEKDIDNKKERNLQERSENLLSKTPKQKAKYP